LKLNKKTGYFSELPVRNYPLVLQDVGPKHHASRKVPTFDRGRKCCALLCIAYRSQS
jgi:hypothetical protein